MVKDFRFGVGVRAEGSRATLQETARRFEGLGFDVLNVPDHLGAPAPFPTLVAAAQATTTIRLGTSGVPDLSLTRRYAPRLADERLLAMPGVLTGSPGGIADTLRGYRETYGLTYLTVQDHHADSFAKVIAELR